MFLEPRKKNICFTQAVTPAGERIHAADTEELRRRAGLTEESFWHAVCKSMSERGQEEHCVYAGETGSFPTPSVEQAIGFAEALTGPMVEQEEADRRARICRMCPHNVELAGCSGCLGLVSRLIQSVNGRRTRHDDALGGCTKCGCALRAKVHYERTTVPEAPEWCWAKEA